MRAFEVQPRSDFCEMNGQYHDEEREYASSCRPHRKIYIICGPAHNQCEGAAEEWHAATEAPLPLLQDCQRNCNTPPTEGIGTQL